MGGADRRAPSRVRRLRALPAPAAEAPAARAEHDASGQGGVCPRGQRLSGAGLPGTPQRWIKGSAFSVECMEADFLKDFQDFRTSVWGR